MEKENEKMEKDGKGWRMMGREKWEKGGKGKERVWERVEKGRGGKTRRVKGKNVKREKRGVEKELRKEELEKRKGRKWKEAGGGGRWIFLSCS